MRWCSTFVPALLAAGALASVSGAAPAAGPTLVASPASARPGVTIVLTGRGWPAGATVSLLIGPWRAGADPAGTVRANGAGFFRKAFPLSAKTDPGEWAFVACVNGCRVKRVARFALVDAIERGTVTFGRGAAGITVGMTRAQVVTKLGLPRYENRNGFMQYAREGLFDVYLDRAKKKVDLIGLAGPRFCTAERICVGDSMREVFARYGSRVKPYTAPDERSFVLVSTFGKTRTYTTFLVQDGKLTRDAKILQFFIGACAGTSYCR